MEIDEQAVKLNAKGISLMNESKLTEAIQTFRKAIELAPGYALAYKHLAQAYEAKKMEDEAEEWYAKAVDADPSLAIEELESGLDSLLTGPWGKVVARYKAANYSDEEIEAPRRPAPADEPVILSDLGGGAGQGAAVVGAALEAGEDDVFDPAALKAMTGGDSSDAPGGPASAQAADREPDLGGPEPAPWAPEGESEMETLSFDQGGGDFDPNEMFRIGDVSTPVEEGGSESGMESLGFSGERASREAESAIGAEPSASPRSELSIDAPFSVQEPGPETHLYQEEEPENKEESGMAVAELIPVSALIACKAGEQAPLNIRVVAVDQTPLADKSVRLSLMGDHALVDYAAFVAPNGQEKGNACTVTSDFTGAVSMYIKMPAKAGIMTCKAKCDAVETVISIQVESREARRIKVEASNELAHAGRPVQATATALDEYDNPVAGEFVTLLISNCQGDPGELREQPSTISNDKGQVYASYMPSSRAGDFVEISAACASVQPDQIRPVRITTGGEFAEPAREPSAAPQEPRRQAAAEKPAARAAAPSPPPKPKAAPAPQAQAQSASNRPVFKVKKGKKAVVDVQAQLPKLGATAGAMAAVLVIAFVLFKIYVTVMVEVSRNTGIKKNNQQLFVDAEFYFKRCLRYKEDDERCLKALAHAYKSNASHEVGNNNDAEVRQYATKAIATLNKLLKVDRKNSDAQYDIGLCYELMGEKEEAIRAYEKLEKMDKSYTSAADKIKTLREEMDGGPSTDEEGAAVEEGDEATPEEGGSLTR